MLSLSYSTPATCAITPYLGGRNDLFEGPFLGGYMNFNENKKSVTHQVSVLSTNKKFE
ncbi:MAG: hypothetical protein Ct9H90mP20_0320 [Candidatus Neomarinimicrobiota bacterium]|nr:MAG: hypothetical protein Ct9H90mP20_0320 [Candidatus Neomarinimicrobiota bacterium]